MYKLVHSGSLIVSQSITLGLGIDTDKGQIYELPARLFALPRLPSLFLFA